MAIDKMNFYYNFAECNAAITSFVEYKHKQHTNTALFGKFKCIMHKATLSLGIQ